MALPQPLPRAQRDAIVDLLDRSGPVLGLSLCLHDFSHRCGLPARLLQHRNVACQRRKASTDGICDRYGSVDVHRAALAHCDGWIHCCPYGFSEIAAPVRSAGVHVGLLFAGTCWLGSEPAPDSDLIVPPYPGWLEERIPLVRSVAIEIGVRYAGAEAYYPDDRRARILGYLRETIERPVTVEDIAGEIGLSVSRTAHVITDLFGRSPAHVIRAVKMEEAAHLLAISRLPISEVGALVGYCDANYFSRVFKTVCGVSPRSYRDQHVDGGI
ncbi:MAG: AraC family transcriptional regulator [Planctomycetota bacterium]|jgi:AraC-like DNA-binding protein|nr:AraC family transcriptional regulator [Planctomycetota bacterium]